MLPLTLAVAERAAAAAARAKLHLFAPWPRISREDLVQHAMLEIWRANYDLSKSAFFTFAYRVASNRILDYLDACKVRGVEVRLSDQRARRETSPPGGAGHARGSGRGLPAADGRIARPALATALGNTPGHAAPTRAR